MFNLEVENVSSFCKLLFQSVVKDHVMTFKYSKPEGTIN